MLAGTEGPAVQKAMQIVVALAEIYEAAELVPVASAQIAGVSYKNLGDAGLGFLEEWAALGARARVPAFMNPAGMDLERWREMGIAPTFAHQQQRVVETLDSMGVALTCTCTPYLVGYVPQAGEHLAWSESSAATPGIERPGDTWPSWNKPWPNPPKLPLKSPYPFRPTSTSPIQRIKLACLNWPNSTLLAPN